MWFFKKKAKIPEKKSFIERVNDELPPEWKLNSYKHVTLTDPAKLFGEYYDLPLNDFHYDSGEYKRSFKDRCEKKPFKLEPFRYSSERFDDLVRIDDVKEVANTCKEAIERFCEMLKNVKRILDLNKPYCTRVFWQTADYDQKINIFTIVRPIDIDPMISFLKKSNAPFVKEFRDHLIQSMAYEFDPSGKTLERLKNIGYDMAVQYDYPTLHIPTFGEWLESHQQMLDRQATNKSIESVLNEIKNAMRLRVDQLIEAREKKEREKNAS